MPLAVGSSIGITTTESIFNKVGEINVFLSDEALGGQTTLPSQVDDRADTGSCRQLNRTPWFSVNVLRIDFAGVAHLNQVALAPT